MLEQDELQIHQKDNQDFREKPLPLGEGAALPWLQQCRCTGIHFHQGQQRAAGAPGANSSPSKYSSEKEQAIELWCVIILQNIKTFIKAIPG